MRRTALLATIVFALAGCGGTAGEVNNDEVAGSNRPTSEASETSSKSSPSKSSSSSSARSSSPRPTPTTPAPPPPAPNPTFGNTFTYENGLSVTISPPQPYTPSDTAYIREPAPPAFVVFDVTIVNGAPANYEPGSFFATMQSANVEAEAVFDAGGGINGNPSTVLLPGRETTFRMAFGATDPADLVLEVSPGYEYDAAVFTS